MPTEPSYVFAPFRLSPADRSLTANDMPLKLGGRAFDTLLALVQRRDRMVTKSELLDIVWPRLVVEENNLQVQIVTLRKLLGHHAVATIPGRGYRFTMPVEVEGHESPAAPSIAALDDSQTRETSEAAAHAAWKPAVANLPRHGDALFGRADDVIAIGAAVRSHRVVTIAGAGGIGKTRAAEAAAAVACADFLGGVWWVELASLTDPDLVPSAVARALGLPLPAAVSDTLLSIVARVADQSMLVVLDNCEHLLEGVAAFVESMLAATPRLHLLVTSQELLKVSTKAFTDSAPSACPQRRPPQRTSRVARASSWWRAFARCCLASSSPRKRQRRPSRSVGDSTEFPWPSSWPRHGFRCSASKGCGACSTSAFGC